MTSNRKERLALVTKRLEDELVQQNDFFHSCCELALGCKISEESHAYLSYRVCRETLGHKNGVYLCLLYAQLYAANCLLTTYGSQIDEQLRDEFTCVNRELLSQILLMTAQHDGPEQIRDALYWFYSDYCELFVQLHAVLLSNNISLTFGGPFLISTLQDNNLKQWQQHMWDCGLYLGKRFEERFFQSVKKVFSQPENTNCFDCYINLFSKQVSIDTPVNEGFLLTLWQKKQWEQMTTQLRLMAK